MRAKIDIKNALEISEVNMQTGLGVCAFAPTLVDNSPGFNFSAEESSEKVFKEKYSLQMHLDALYS